MIASRTAFALVVIAAGTVAATTLAAEAGGQPSVVPGRVLASQCAQCHGTDGVSVADIDSLAGEDATDMYDKLLDMKEGDDSDMMHSQARGYTDPQLRLIAEYFATLPKAHEDEEDN